MSETIQVQQRFPGPLLSSIDTWAAENHFTRTAAVNYMCGKFLGDIEVERLRAENEELRRKIVKIAMDVKPKEVDWPKAYNSMADYKE